MFNLFHRVSLVVLFVILFVSTTPSAVVFAEDTSKDHQVGLVTSHNLDSEVNRLYAFGNSKTREAIAKYGTKEGDDAIDAASVAFEQIITRTNGSDWKGYEGRGAVLVLHHQYPPAIVAYQKALACIPPPPPNSAGQIRTAIANIQKFLAAGE